jgi:AcrR family transcriptional regulator
MNYPVNTDAAPGRRALLGAAAEVLAEHGLDAPLELIAERAGVGRDTISRDFPDPVALAVAAVAQDVEDLSERTTSWAGEADVFLWFLEEIADLCVRNASVSDGLRSAAPDAMAQLRRMIIDAGSRALHDAQMAGLVRADLKAPDISTIVTLLGAGLSGDLAERQAISLRTREIILSGLRARR